jgi:hypothetical protein
MAHYPPENGARSGITFIRWFVDDITGALVAEDRIVRDYERALVCIDDVDLLGRDDLIAQWTPRAEAALPEP